jgi:hypothetical protein
MKEIKKEVSHTVTTYEAVDGTPFTNKEECEKYEQTAKCALQQRYRPLVVRTDTECNIFGGVGSEDCTVDIVKISKSEDIDTLLQLYRLNHAHLERPEYKHWVDEAHKKCSLALQGSGYVFVGRGCEEDNFWIIGSQDSAIQAIKDACKLAKETNEK